MARLWNLNIWTLQTKFVVVLVLLLLGSFTLQSYVHGINEERLLEEVNQMNRDLAEEVSDQLAQRTLLFFGAQYEVTIPPESFREAILEMGGGRRGTVLRLNPNRFKESLDRMIQEVLRDQIEKFRSVAQNGMVQSALVQGRRAPWTRDSQRWLDVPVRDLERSELGHTPLGKGVIDQSNSLVPDPAFPFSSPALTPRPSNSPVEDLELPLDTYTRRFEELLSQYRRHDLLATVGIFLMGIAFAWLLGVRMTKPVYDMVEGLRAVSEGDLEARVTAKKSGEFGMLGEQFNRMVERLRETREMERELEQRERIQMMGDLAAGVAHDVRNPLNAIHLNIGQIRDEFLPADSHARERFLRFTSDVRNEVERLNELVTNFLSLAKPTSEDMVPVDPNELLSELWRLIRKEAGARKVEIGLDLDEGLPVLVWNRQEMMSAFLNVTINAIQAMEPEGGALSVLSSVREAYGPEQAIDSETGARIPPRPREVAISFVDTGRGITEQDLEKVFIPYFTTRSGGTGLGMAIARRATERNGGRIEIRSRAEEGTSVTFLFRVDSSEERLRDRSLAS